MAKSSKRKQSEIAVKLPRGMSFEDAVRHVLKAGPAPKPKRKRSSKRR